MASEPAHVEPRRPARIWIDLDNAPHVPFFAPIVAELRARGHEVIITAGTKANLGELLKLHGLTGLQVGRNYGRRKVVKAGGLVARALRIVPYVYKSKPDLALSHGSRTQGLVAALLGIKRLVIIDYEFVNQTLLAWRRSWALVPEVIPTSSIRLAEDRVLTYPGIKEDVYVPSFRPDPTIRAKLGISEAEVLVTLRPPAVEAHYHNPEAEGLFREVMAMIAQTDGVRAVVLPRSAAQAGDLEREYGALLASRKAVIPDRVVDGLNLIWFSDLVVSGGGTMNREAAALGVPVYSIFRGRIGAVDRHLAASGRLVLIESVSEVREKVQLRQRTRPASPGPAATVVLAHVVRTVESLASEPVSRGPR